MIAFKLGSPDSHMRDGEASSRVCYSYFSTFSSCFYLEYKSILYTLSFEVGGGVKAIATKTIWKPLDWKTSEREWG